VYDTINTQGQFILQAKVACEGNAQEDRLFLLDGDCAPLVRGWNSAARSLLGATAKEEGAEEVTSLEAIYFEVKP
jgi:hypothetical protein